MMKPRGLHEPDRSARSALSCSTDVSTRNNKNNGKKRPRVGHAQINLRQGAAGLWHTVAGRNMCVLTARSYITLTA